MDLEEVLEKSFNVWEILSVMKIYKVNKKIEVHSMSSEETWCWGCKLVSPNILNGGFKDASNWFQD